MLWFVVGLGAVAHTAHAQRPDSSARPPADSTRQRAAAPQRALRDSLKPPISPGRAFLYSLVIPGLAQARLDRHAAGAVYVAIEGMSVAMAAKSANELRIARAHAHDVVAGAYRTNPDGSPVVDSTGSFVRADTAENRYAGQRVKARRTHYEDWIAALIFNHLFAGADAFVSAQLWDLPAQVGLRAAPAIPGALALVLIIRW